MLVTAWILFVVFGLLALTFLRKLYFVSLHNSECVLMVISIIVAALSAGYIFGGLHLVCG
jgi:hypothetical protein